MSLCLSCNSSLFSGIINANINNVNKILIIIFETNYRQDSINKINNIASVHLENIKILPYYELIFSYIKFLLLLWFLLTTKNRVITEFKNEWLSHAFKAKLIKYQIGSFSLRNHYNWQELETGFSSHNWKLITRKLLELLLLLHNS